MQYFLYKIAMWFSLRLPLKLSYALASFVAGLQYKVCRKDRNAVISNIKVILNTQDEKIVSDAAKKVFINFAKYLVDFFRFSIVDKEYIKKFIKIEGQEYIDEAFKRGKGVIALTAHISNWELAGIVISLLGYPVNAIALSHKNIRVNELFVGQRQCKGVKVIPLGAAVRKCFIALKNNELIGVLGDRDFTQGGIVVEFLGKMVSMPKGPATFCLKSGAAIIPTFMIRQPDDSYKLIYEKPINCPATGNMKDDLKAITKEVAVVIEKKIRLYPEHWSMFREFWDENANKI